MFCSQCGVQNLDTNLFCHACGYDLSRSRPPEQTGPGRTAGPGTGAPRGGSTPPPPRPPADVDDVGDLPTQLESFAESEMGLVDGRLQLLEKLGEGGMGTVWKARDVRLGRIVALKRPKAEMLTTEGRARFMREAQSSARLSHPGIITIYAVGEDAAGPFLEMEYIPGSSLRDEVRRNKGGLDEKWVRELGVQLCGALALAHSQGIIHRDIKPANILLTQQGQAKLGDFGLAAAGGELGSMTASGAVMGTLFYASPEQLRGAHGLDGRSDVYSLGATLYFALTGDDPRVIRLEKVPATLRPVLHKALEEQPEDRWADMGQFEQALKAPAAAAPPKPPEIPKPLFLQNLQNLMKAGQYGKVIEAIQRSLFHQDPEFKKLAAEAQELDSPVARLIRQVEPLRKARAYRQVAALLDRIKQMGGNLPEADALSGECEQAMAQARDLLGRAGQALAAGKIQAAHELCRQGQQTCSDMAEFAELDRKANDGLKKEGRSRWKKRAIYAAAFLFIGFCGLAYIGYLTEKKQQENNRKEQESQERHKFDPKFDGGGEIQKPPMVYNTPVPPPPTPPQGPNQAEVTQRMLTLFSNFWNTANPRVMMLPSNVQYMINQGRMYSTANNFQGALASFDQAVAATSSQEPISLFLAGWANLMVGNYTNFNWAMDSAKRVDNDGSLSRYIDESKALAQDLMKLSQTMNNNAGSFNP